LRWKRDTNKGGFMDAGHKKLEIYRLAHSLAVKVHKMTLSLPQFERYEEGNQIRRSAKSISANIVEGYTLRRYKNEFIHYLFRAYGSAEETIEHLELLFETGSLTDETVFKDLVNSYNSLCGKILRYIQAVDKSFEMPLFMKESEAEYFAGQGPDAPKEGSNPQPLTLEPPTDYS
jgi:four helix bundle protein